MTVDRPSNGVHTSYGAEVRRLFRHLHNQKALQANTLARELFDAAAEETSNSSVDSVAALRSKILDAGRELYVEDLADEPAEKAERRRAILEGICAGRAANELARELRVSRPQFYRDRRFVCERVIRRMLSKAHAHNGSALSFDPLRLALWRVDALCEQGLGEKAIAECERILAQTPAEHAKAITWFELGEAALKVGDVALAARAFADGNRLAAVDQGIYPWQARTRAGLLEYRLAMHDGRHADGMAIVRQLVEKAPIGAGPADTADLTIEVLLEWSRCSAYMGNSAESGKALAGAARIVQKNPLVGFGRRVEVAVLSATLGQEALLDPAMRAHRLREALALAFSSGSAMGVLFASVALAYASATLQDHAQSRSYVDQALRVARRMEGRQALLFALASLAQLLVQRGEALAVFDPALFDLESLTVPMSDIWTNLKVVKGAVLAAHYRHEEAAEALACAAEGARVLDRNRLRTTALRLFALSAHATGRSSDAADGIRSALNLVRTGSSAAERASTQLAAARILGNGRSGR